jgi:hypothetical protein
MKVKFAYTCPCGANGVVQQGEDSISKGMTLVGNCMGCTNTIVIGIDQIDKDLKVVKYTVQIRKTEKE